MRIEELRSYREEVRTRVAALASNTRDRIAAIAALNAALGGVVGEFKERNQGEWHDGQFQIVQTVVEEALARAEAEAIAAVVAGDEPLRAPLRDYFLLEGVERYDQGRVRWDQIARLGDAESVQKAFEAAARELRVESDDDFNAFALLALVPLAKEGPHRARAAALIRGGFGTAKKAHPDCVNDKVFATLARCLCAMGDRALAPQLHDAFAFAADDEQDYELNLAAARMAIYLTSLGYQGPLDALRKFVAYAQQTYAGEAFTLRACYALWYFEDDGAAACAYIEDRNNKKSLGLAATACADLHYQAAIPVLRSRLDELENSVAREIFAEVILRLEEQRGRPEDAARMIWMHGLVARTERSTDLSMTRRARSWGSCVAMPTGQRPVWQMRYCWQPIATMEAVASATASAPSARALAMSLPSRKPPVAHSVTSLP